MSQCEFHLHDHGEDNCGNNGGISIDSHEGALIGTLTGHIAADSIDSAKELLSRAMKELAEIINGSGGIIGHIKAIVSEEGRGYQISVTDEDAVERSLPPSAYRADFTAIIFAVEDDTLREYMRRTVGALIVPDENSCDCGHEHRHEHDHK